MEKVTIQKVGQEKEVQTKFGPKKKTGVIFKEYPDVWHDTWLSGLKEGQVLEGTRESRDYQGKTYWNFNLPKKGEASDKKLDEALHYLLKINMGINELLEEKRKNDKPKISGTDVDYPIGSEDEEPAF